MSERFAPGDRNFQGRLSHAGRAATRRCRSYPEGREAVDFGLSQERQEIRDAVLRHCSQFSDDYWLERDESGLIPEDAIERITVPFYSTKPRGTGLGLPLVALMALRVPIAAAMESGQVTTPSRIELEAR